MPGYDVPGLPGIRAAKTASHRRILRQGDYTFLAGVVNIDGTKARDTGNTGDLDVLRPGLPMGYATSGGLWSNSIMGLTNAAAAVGATSITLTSAAATELNRRVGASGTFKLTGPPSAAGTVVTETVTYSAVNTTTGVATVTAITNAFISGSFVQPTDGSERPRSFIPDGFSTIKATDNDGTSLASVEWPTVPVAGVIDASQLLFWPSDTSLQAWLVARLNDASGGQFVFDHHYGM